MKLELFLYFLFFDNNLHVYNHYNNDLNTAKTDIKNKVDLASKMNNLVTYPFLIIRYYCTESLSISANGFRWVDITKCKTSGGNPDKDDYFTSTKENYIASGIIGFGGGESNGVAYRLALNSAVGTGFRLFNFSSSTITTTTKLELNSDGSIKNRPPFVDVLYIRKDMFLY